MKLVNPDGSETYYKVFSGDRAYVETTGSLNKQPHKQTAKTLLLLHGIGADHKMWQPQIQSYTAAGYRLLIPDLFGHGRSSFLNQIELHDWHNQINWLLDHCKTQHCTVIGVSMGGVIAQSFVVNYPERTEAIVLTDTFGELRTPKEKMLGLSQVIGFQLFRLLGKSLLMKTMRSVYQANHAQAAQAYFDKVSLEADIHQMLLARKAINRIDSLNRLKSITTPALVMVGEDLGEWFVEINRKIANALPQAEFVTLAQSIDPSNLVNPDEFNKQVLSFLKTKIRETV